MGFAQSFSCPITVLRLCCVVIGDVTILPDFNVRKTSRNVSYNGCSLPSSPGNSLSKLDQPPLQNNNLIFPKISLRNKIFSFNSATICIAFSCLFPHSYHTLNYFVDMLLIHKWCKNLI